MLGIWHSNDSSAGRAALAPFVALASASNGTAFQTMSTFVEAHQNFSGGLGLPIAGKQKSAFLDKPFPQEALDVQKKFYSQVEPLTTTLSLPLLTSDTLT